VGAATAATEGGQIHLRTTVLLTAEEMDEAVKTKTGPFARHGVSGARLWIKIRKRTVR